MTIVTNKESKYVQFPANSQVIDIVSVIRMTNHAIRMTQNA